MWWLSHLVSTRDPEALIRQVVDAADPEAWKKAAEAVAASPHYGGLVLKPQVGLRPLGPDPESGLWEFAHVTSGKVPVRGKDSRLAVDGETGVVLVLVPGGTFLMGSEKFSYEGPVHRVTVPPFLMAKHELTQGQLERLTGKNPSQFQGDNQRPADSQSFDEAQAAAAAGGLRLPTEAEWEYAARAGTTTDYWWGDEPNAGGKVWANCGGCGSRWDGKETAPVGAFPANPFGLHDTAGNVWEWVQDSWHDNYQGAPVDSSAWEESAVGGPRVLRGGSWSARPGRLRAAYRFGADPGYRLGSAGFRLARTLTL